MKLTPKLLGYLNRVFSRDPDQFVAFRVNYDGGLVWTVAEGMLTLSATGGSGASQTYDLEAYSIRTLVAAIAGQTGYTVSAIDAARADLAAVVLLDGTGDQAQSNGNALFGYTSLLYAIFEACSRQLQIVADQIGQAILQMNTRDAAGVWLDELGSYYGVPRLSGEADALYGPRIIAQTLRPLANNVAMEMAIEDYTGQPVSVVDVVIYRGVFPLYDGSILYDGAHDYDTEGFPNYGLFDVLVSYDLVNGGDISGFLTIVEGIVDRLRAGGTHLRSLALSSIGTPLSDTMDPPTDNLSSFTAIMTIVDAFTAPTDSLSPLQCVLEPFSDTMAAPTDTAVGGVFVVMRSETGEILTTAAGEPLLASIGSLFD